MAYYAILLCTHLCLLLTINSVFLVFAMKLMLIINCIVQSLSGHSSAVESATFDSAEALVVAGAAVVQ